MATAVKKSTRSASKPKTSAKPATRASRAKAATPAAKKAVKKPAAKAPTRKPAAPKAAAAGKAKKKDKTLKAKKVKLIRDSFTMPEGEYAQLAALKKRCLKAGMSVKKSEVLRAALACLAKLSDATLLAKIRGIEVIKTGRPAKA